LGDLPVRLWDRYGVFLTLCKRVMEAGFVNTLGGLELSDIRLSTVKDTFVPAWLPSEG
jgi:hypothetical protein